MSGLPRDQSEPVYQYDAKHTIPGQASQATVPLRRKMGHSDTPEPVGAKLTSIRPRHSYCSPGLRVVGGAVSIGRAMRPAGRRCVRSWAGARKATAPSAVLAGPAPDDVDVYLASTSPTRAGVARDRASHRFLGFAGRSFAARLRPTPRFAAGTRLKIVVLVAECSTAPPSTATATALTTRRRLPTPDGRAGTGVAGCDARALGRRAPRRPGRRTRRRAESSATPRPCWPSADVPSLSRGHSATRPGGHRLVTVLWRPVARADTWWRSGVRRLRRKPRI